jgi:hypothetical protein
MLDNSDKKSKILLLCLGIGLPRPVISDIRIQDLVNLFEHFGFLKKIMIFSKSAFVKAFVEFDSQEVAELVKETLHESVINNLGLTKVYYSGLKEVKCSNNFLDFWEGAKHICKEGLTNSTKEITRRGSMISQKDYDLLLNLNWSNDSSPALTTDTKMSSCPLKTEENFEDTFAGKTLLKRYSLELSPRHFRFGSEANVSLENLSKVPTTQVATSKVILASNLNNYFESSEEILNLFGCFGNVNKILLMKNLQKALIEFSSLESAGQCVENLGKRQNDNLMMRLAFSNYQRIDLKKSQKSETSQKFNDILLVSNTKNRFNSLDAKFCPPSSSILVSVKKQDDLNFTDSCLLVKECLRNLCIQTTTERLDYSDEKLIRVVFKLQSVSQSILAITKLNGSIANKSPIEVNFHP